MALCGNRWAWQTPKLEGAKNTTFADTRAGKGHPPALPVQDDLSEGCRGQALPTGTQASGHRDWAALGTRLSPVRPAGSPRQVVPASGGPWAQLSSRALCPAPTSSPCPARAHHCTRIFLPGVVLLEHVGGNKTDGQRSVRLRLCGPLDIMDPRT